MSETIQSIEVTLRPDDTITENDEYIQSEKRQKIERLRQQYGQIDETQIMWVMVKKKTPAEVRGAA